MSEIRRKAYGQKGSLVRHKASVVAVIFVLLLLVAVVTVGSISLKEKQRAYIKQEAELEEQIVAQEERAEEIAELEKYVGTDEYIEQTAKDKLGLIREGEILFKRK